MRVSSLVINFLLNQTIANYVFKHKPQIYIV